MKPLSQNTMVQGRYLIVHMIGKGGMGEVYLAVDQRLGSAVALKRTVFSEDETLCAAFEREAKILGRLRHPVLPKVSDHFTENGDQFLVMEHISGDDLSKRLEASGKPFPLSWVMFWADQLLDALTYMHSHEPPIIHRDIKPQNLKLTDDNHIVLLDFGLSKDSQALTASDQPMVSASVVGYTPHFAPMEQIRGTGTTARSDIYSFSATFYQLMTNVVPMDALARADAMLSGGPDPLAPPHLANPEISEDISKVILKGVEVSQEKRFGTAAEMQKELRRAFKKTQDAMAAKTVAFADHAAVTELDDPAAHVTAPPSEMDTVIQPTADLGSLDTVRDAAPKQDDIKTAIISPDALTEDVDLQKTEIMPPPAAAATAQPGAPPPPAPLKQSAAAASAAAPTSAAPAKKKSRAGLVIGILIGVLLLFGAAAGGGWFAYKKYYSKAAPLPSPSPQVAQASPSPEPTIETVEDPGRDVGDNTAEVQETPSRTESEPGTPGKQPGTTKNQPSRTATSQPPAQPKTPPKGKPKDERTVILQ